MNITDLKKYSDWLKGRIDFTKHDVSILNHLVSISKSYGKPLCFSSSYRTPLQNVSCGGSPTSSHLYGLAFDIICTTSTDRFKLLQSCILLGVTRIGIYKNFIHIDFDADKAQSVVWYG